MRNGKHEEPGLVTTGDDLLGLSRLLKPAQLNYTAAEVVAHILG
jgi:hypothetical protein